MADVEEPLLFQSVWIRQVNEMLYSERSLANEFPLPRVAKPLRTTKQEAYIPQFLSLGPYHHSRLKKDGTYQYLGLKMSAAEAYKVISAATISRRKNLADTVEDIRRIQPHILSLYDLQIPQDDDFSANFALMMAVDSCFLLSFLFGCSGLEVPDPEIDFYLDIDFSQLQVYIKCDILKLENQIPLSALNLVFQNAREVFVGPLIFPIESFRELLQVAYEELSPFDMRFDIYHQIPNDVINDLDREPHILGCIHRIVSRILQPSAPEGATLVQRIYGFIDKYVVVKLCGIFFCFTPPTDIDRLIKGYSAGQLARAGVKFKSFSELHENIRFEECSHTLYLPPLTIISSIQTDTEVFFRNLVALEFNDPARHKVVTQYVGLMDGLIDTPDDVRVLMDSHVIRRGSLMLTEEHIAKLWDGMCQPFVTGHLEPPYVLKSAFEKEVKKKYYKVKVKIRIAETWEYCYGKFLSRPWKFVALLFAIFLIILNCIQACCSLYKCKSDN